MSNITGVSAPVVGEDRTTYSTKITDSLDAIDAHDHTSGKGKQIPTGGIEDLAVSTAKIAASAVTAAKVADTSLTIAKLAQLSTGTSVGNFNSSAVANYTSTGSETDGPSVTLSVLKGRPVLIFLFGDDTTPGFASSGAASACNVRIKANGTPIAKTNYAMTDADNVGLPGVFVYIPAADTTGMVFLATIQRVGGASTSQMTCGIAAIQL